MSIYRGSYVAYAFSDEEIVRLCRVESITLVDGVQHLTLVFIRAGEASFTVIPYDAARIQLLPKITRESAKRVVDGNNGTRGLCDLLKHLLMKGINLSSVVHQLAKLFRRPSAIGCIWTAGSLLAGAVRLKGGSWNIPANVRSWAGA
jgi:hypothetical protein